MVSTDKPMAIKQVKVITSKLASTPLASGVKKTPILSVSKSGGIAVARPLEIVKSAQVTKAKATAMKKMPNGIDQIIGGVAGVVLGQALQNPFLSKETNQKILVQSVEQGLSGGIGKVAGVIPAGLGGTVGYAISGPSGITQGVTQGPIQTITNTVNKEYVERITNTIETVKESGDLFKGAGEFLQKYGIWIAVGVGALILIPSLTRLIGRRD